MNESADDGARCAAAVADLAASRGWRLDDAEQRAYVAALVPLLPPGVADEVLRRTIVNYHEDHEQVAALLGLVALQHDDAWAQWSGQTSRILRRRLPGVDVDDLTQQALIELARSLPSYCYASRFSTWAYRLISNTASHTLRSQSARKRSGVHLPLEAADMPGAPVADPPGDGALLLELAQTILREHGGDRLAEIFRLWAVGDHRLAEIGRVVNLTPGRVSVLLRQACDTLARHPAIRAWLELPDSDESSEDSPEN